MSQCNYCTLQSIKEEAKANNQIVTVLDGNVYVRDKQEELDLRSPDDGNKQWKAWMMEIPKQCEC